MITSRRKATIWRVYCNGVELGVDFRSLSAAQAAKASYQADWPRLKYYVRAVRPTTV